MFFNHQINEKQQKHTYKLEEISLKHYGKEFSSQIVRVRQPSFNL